MSNQPLSNDMELTPLEWHNERRKVNDLLPYDQNPRELSEAEAAQLKKSLEKFNLVEVPAINLDNMLVAGHQRMKIMQLLGRGDEEIDVRVPNRTLTTDEFREYLVRSNRNHGTWDWEVLANAFDPSELLAWGFTEAELEFKDDKLTTGDDDLPDSAKVVPVSVSGDLYEVAVINGPKLRLLCGDATSMDAVNKVMDGNLGHISVTDPPYNVAYGKSDHPSYRTGPDRQIMNDSMTDEQFLQFSRDYLTSIHTCLHPGGMVYICMSCQEWGTMMQATKEAGFHWSATIIWNKSHAVMSRGDYHRKFEPIFYGWRDDAARLAPLEDRQQNDVWDIDRPTKSDLHPTTKPVEIYTRAIENSSKRNDNVIEFFSGSGTAGIACLKLNRNLFAMELDPKYVDVGVRRWCDFMKENNMEYTLTRNGQPFILPDKPEATLTSEASTAPTFGEN